MYSIVLMASFASAPGVPECNRAERVAARRSVASAGCSGVVAVRGFRTPLRSILAQAAAPRTTYYSPAAKYIAVPAQLPAPRALPPVQQTAPPPKVAVAPLYFATPIRNAVRRCPIGVSCP